LRKKSQFEELLWPLFWRPELAIFTKGRFFKQNSLPELAKADLS
jgi:hypothetical protein